MIAPERALAIQKLAATFKSDTARPPKCSETAGPYAAASPVLQLGLLRMRPLQRWLKPTVSTQRMASWRLHIRVNQACVTALTPWKNPRWMKKGVAMGVGPHQESCHDRRLQHRLGGAVRRQTDLRPLVEGGERLPHQLLGNASSLSDLIGRHVLIRSDSMSMHDSMTACPITREVSPRSASLFWQSAFWNGLSSTCAAEGSTPAGQTEPRSGYFISEQCPLRGVDAPSAGDSEDLEDLGKAEVTFSPPKTTHTAQLIIRRTGTRWPTTGPTSSFMHFP